MLNVLDEKHLYITFTVVSQTMLLSVLSWPGLHSTHSPSLPDQLIPVTELWPGLPDITTIQRKMPKY